jgi:hypothetical protein
MIGTNCNELKAGNSIRLISMLSYPVSIKCGWDPLKVATSQELYTFLYHNMHGSAIKCMRPKRHRHKRMIGRTKTISVIKVKVPIVHYAIEL